MNMYPNNPLNLGSPIYNPYINQLPSNPIVPNYQPVISQGPRMEVQRVNGKESAMAYNIGPNSSVILADATNPKIWLVTTDASGFKAVTGFKIVPDDEPERTAEDPIKALNERLDRLEERMNNYGKPNPKSSWQNKPGNASAQSDDRNGSRIEGPAVNTATNGQQ